MSCMLLLHQRIWSYPAGVRNHRPCNAPANVRHSSKLVLSQSALLGLFLRTLASQKTTPVMHFSVWHTSSCSRTSCYPQIKSVGTHREASMVWLQSAKFFRLQNFLCIHKAQLVLIGNLLKVAKPSLHTHNPAENTIGSIGTKLESANGSN